MRIILARHAETVYNAGARMQGHMAHTPLTRAGIAQAEAMGTALAAHLDAEAELDIWASPAGRTLQTVAIIARITASGPATVVWHWSSSAGVVSPDKQILFEAGDTKTVQDYYQVFRVSDYIVEVQTTLPNIMTGQASFKVVCTP